MIAEDIGNRRSGRRNFTDFYLLAEHNSVEYDPCKEYLTMVAITPHYDEPGLLAGILNQVAWHGLNNAKIHSRPALDDTAIGDELEPQMFYLEVIAHKDSPNLVRCVESLRYKLTPQSRDVETVRVLGSYEKPKL